MEIAEKAYGFLAGDKLYQQRARDVLPILVRQAKAAQKIYYSDLAAEIGISNPRTLNYPLGSIGNALKSLETKWGKKIPQIQCIVVSKGSELPGEGIGWFIDKNDFKKLSTRQKREIINHVLSDVFAFDKWDEVLLDLGLQPLRKVEGLEELINKAKKYGAAGESKQHKALKEALANNPSLLGLSMSGYTVETEYAFPSADTIDILFKGPKECIGVEVKSEISSVEDIMRGLFQCVKYQALMEASLSVTDQTKNVMIILALGSVFPPELVPIKNILGVSVVDKIKA